MQEMTTKFSSPFLLPLLFCVVIVVIAVQPVASQTDIFTTTTPAPSYSEGIIDFGDLSPTPTPSVSNFGLENVGQGIQRTISPTVNTALITGRGMPSRTPTYEPSLNPTERGFGTGVTIPIPGVDMNTLQPASTAITEAEVTQPTNNSSKSISRFRGCWSLALLVLLLLP